MSVNWQSVREQFPILEKWTYLNTATFGPVPTCAVQAAFAHFRRRDEEGCLDFLDWFTDAEAVRAQAAKLVAAHPDDVAFIPNAGTALAWVMNGIDWQPDDHILTLSDEFPNNLYFPKVLEQRGVRVTEACLAEGRFSLKQFLAQVTDRTRVVLVSSVNYSTGLRLPLREIGSGLREQKALLYVDGTQSVGALGMDVRANHIDVLAVHGYKWMLCPTGIGFAYIRPEVREWLEPSVYSWRSHRGWREVDHLHHGVPDLPSGATKYEGGGQNFSGIFAMGAVLDLLESLGPAAVEERVMEIADKTRDTLRSQGGELLCDQHPYYDSPIIAARFPGVDVSQLAVDLRSRRIAVAARKGNLRASPHFFNNEADLDKLGAAMEASLTR